MKSPDQPSLFDDPNARPTVEPVLDTAAIAARIGANARPIDYADRTSEAARDQGHGPIDLPRATGAVAVAETKPEIPDSVKQIRAKLQKGKPEKNPDADPRTVREQIEAKNAESYWKSQRR